MWHASDEPSRTQGYTRRSFLIATGAFSALACASMVHAQAKRPPVVIAWLHPGTLRTGDYRIGAFRQGMAAHGWQEGTQFVIEERWAETQIDRLPALAAELVAKNPAVFVAGISVVALRITPTVS